MRRWYLGNVTQYAKTVLDKLLPVFVGGNGKSGPIPEGNRGLLKLTKVKSCVWNPVVESIKMLLLFECWVSFHTIGLQFSLWLLQRAIICAILIVQILTFILLAKLRFLQNFIYRITEKSFLISLNPDGMPHWSLYCTTNKNLNAVLQNWWSLIFCYKLYNFFQMVSAESNPEGFSI